MLALNCVLMGGGFGMILVAVSILGSEVYTGIVHRKVLSNAVMTQVARVRRRTSIALVLLAWGPILLAFGVVMTAAAARGCM
jgi:hypothetical protein